MRPTTRLCAATSRTSFLHYTRSSRQFIKIMSTNTPSQSSQTQQQERASQFTKSALDATHLSADPFTQFHDWFDNAAQTVPLHFACTLSTASLPSGRVSARVVYLKTVEDPSSSSSSSSSTTPSSSNGGFVIYTNLETSKKAADLETNPYAALSFWWRELERQVRVEGRTERLSTSESQPYFDSRVRGSRIGAWASPQSQVLSNREELEDKVAAIEEKFRDMGNEVEDGKGNKEKIPCPEFWGGLRIIPESIEFWQGRENRLHDRFLYTRQGTGKDASWKVERLSP